MSASAVSVVGAYLVWVTLAAIGMFIVEWWAAKNDPRAWRLTAAGLLGRIFLALIPFVNILVALGCAIHLVTEIMPKIVLFGKKDTEE